MGLDIGDRTVGVAVSDERAVVATGVAVIRRRPGRAAGDAAAVAELARHHGVELIVAGLPRSLRGEVGPQATKVLEFVSTLKQACPVPVELWDERLTTRIAQRSLQEAAVPRQKRRALIDQVAATVILQGYLDGRGTRQAGRDGCGAPGEAE